MALEMKVYREITQFQPKVLVGMTWRQLLWAAIGTVVVFGAYLPLALLGYSEVASWVSMVAMIPCACLGWVRPHGMPFEQYAGFVWRYRTSPRIRKYAMTDIEVKHVRSTKAIRRVEAH